MQNNGQCGVCGDAYHLNDPRPHEAGGEYAKGTIVRHYTVGQVILFLHIKFPVTHNFIQFLVKFFDLAYIRVSNVVKYK